MLYTIGLYDLLGLHVGFMDRSTICDSFEDYGEIRPIFFD